MGPSATVRWLGYGTGAIGVVVSAVTIGLRLASPWPLEWMEGASLQHALRVAQGLPLYTAPSAEFVPYLYPPLSYLPMALGVWLFGPSLWVGRLVSVLAFAGALACVGRIAERSSRTPAVGCAAMGLYALGFGYTGAFADLVRVDSVFMLLVLLGLERLTAQSVAPGFAWLVASCFAKQHGFLFLAAAWFVHRRDRVTVAWSAGTLAVGVLALEAASGGYFLRYTWSLPRGHGVEPVLLASFIGIDILVFLPVLALFAGLRLSRRDSALGPEWLAWLAAGIAASALGRAHLGGHDNVRMPAFAVLVLAGTIAWRELAARRELWSAAFALQVVLLVQLPAAHAPTAAQAREFESLTSALSRCAAGQLARAAALDHALLTGRPYVHTMALSDLRLSGDPLYGEATHALAEHLAGPDAPASLAVSRTSPELREVIERRYALCVEMPGLRFPTGYEVGPTRVYRRKDVQLAGAGLLWR